MALATAPAHDPTLDGTISAVVATDIITRVAGKRLATTVGRRVPVIGGVVGAGADGFATWKIGRYADRELLPPPPLMRRPLLALVLLTAPLVVASAPVAAAGETCDGRPATIVAVKGQPTRGTEGDDVIVGTEGPDTRGRAGRQRRRLRPRRGRHASRRSGRRPAPRRASAAVTRTGSTRQTWSSPGRVTTPSTWGSTRPRSRTVRRTTGPASTPISWAGQPDGRHRRPRGRHRGRRGVGHDRRPACDQGRRIGARRHHHRVRSRRGVSTPGPATTSSPPRAAMTRSSREAVTTASTPGTAATSLVLGTRCGRRGHRSGCRLRRPAAVAPWVRRVLARCRQGLTSSRPRRRHRRPASGRDEPASSSCVGDRERRSTSPVVPGRDEHHRHPARARAHGCADDLGQLARSGQAPTPGCVGRTSGFERFDARRRR